MSQVLEKLDLWTRRHFLSLGVKTNCRWLAEILVHLDFFPDQSTPLFKKMSVTLSPPFQCTGYHDMSADCAGKDVDRFDAR